VERSSVHIAVLVVADDPATVDLAGATFLADKVTGAGHRVVAQEVVERDESSIRDQLARWVTQGHIDVIVAAGAGEAASAALAPLVTRPIAGLTDQLRLLARDRGSADKPVAARASSKFVFLLPPEIGALGATLNQLVLPQLDSTAERNLVGDMPRFKPAEGVPQTIAAEKTVTGAGVAPKLPAVVREKRKTGANVIARRDDPTKQTRIEDPTKPVELEPRGRMRTAANDAPTRPHIDLASMLPPVPPGADDPDTNDEPALLDGPASRTGQPARARDAVATAKPAPGSTDVTKIAPAPTGRPGMVTPPAGQPTTAPLPKLATPPAGQPSTAPLPKLATPPAGVPKLAPAEPVTPLPSLKPARSFAETIKPATKPAEPGKPLPSIKPPATVKPVHAPAATPPHATPATPAAREARPAPSRSPVAEPPRVAEPPPVAAPPPPAAESPIDVVRPADLEAAAAEEAIDAASSADLIEAATADFEEVATPPRPPAVPPRVPPRPATPPPVAATNGVTVRPPTGPVPVVPSRPATGPAAIVPAVATSAAQMPPIVQPELLDLREGTQKKRRPRTGTAIVRSRSRAPILMYLALAAAAVAGFLAVVHFLPRATENTARVDQPPPAGSDGATAEPAGSALAGSDQAAGSDVAEAGSADAGSADAGSADNDIDIEPPPPHDTVSAHPTHATARPPTHVTAAHTAPTHATHEATPAPAETTKTEPPAEDGCDEVSCVLDKYARACCAKYKPADDAFHPKGTVPDALDKAMVHAGIEKVKPKVVSCGEKIAVKGTVKLAITVAPAGTISQISVAEAPDAALGECVKAAVKRATFGKSVNGASFTYPFAF
jgi:molybdopterin biosynthesis enzyme MoaB